VALSIITVSHYAESRCAGCSVLFIVTLNAVMLSVVMLNAVAPYKEVEK
jgi:hypothetical protein